MYKHSLSFDEIHSRVSRSTNRHEDVSSIEYHIFDIINEDNQMDRISKLQDIKDILHTSMPVKVVPSYLAHDFNEVWDRYIQFLKEGYEGIIVRNLYAPYVTKRSPYVMKFKPKKTDTYQVVGYLEETSISGARKYRVGSLLCTDEEGNEFSVGSGLNDETRELLWIARDSLKGKWCTIEYQHITPKGKVPRFPVFVTLTEEKPKEV